MAQNKEQPTVFILTAEDLAEVMKVIDSGFRSIGRRLDRLEGKVAPTQIAKIGTQSRRNREIATAALKKAVSRPAPARR